MREIALKILRQTFEQFVTKETTFSIPYTLPAEFSRLDNGVYVAAFEKTGLRPRGRVGSYMPVKNSIAEEIQYQAIVLAKTFPFRKQDLPFLTFQLLLIGTPRLLADPNSLRSDHGLLVKADNGKNALSLPGRKMNTPAERIIESCAREGIDKHSASMRFYEFEIETFNE